MRVQTFNYEFRPEALRSATANEFVLVVEITNSE